MRRHGLTLLELLIAIGLLVALAAIVFPPVMGRYRQHVFDAGADLITTQLVLARSHAQATGTAVEVVCNGRPARVSAREFDPAAAADEPPARPAIPESWAEQMLPDGLWIDDPSSEADAGPAGAGDEPPNAALRLAVFMPDGSALLCTPVRLRDRHERSGTVSVNPWTGLCSFDPEVSP